MKRLLELRSLEQQISEAELMIARYQANCFSRYHYKEKSQYESDLIAIRILISKNKDTYRCLPEPRSVSET